MIDLSESVSKVAPRLLGMIIRHGPVAVRLTEVEAYGGADDPASHAFRGPTARNQVMFGPAGRLYVYFSYGMHWAANVVCGPVGSASAVLLRAGEVVDGLATVRERRGPTIRDRDLARGPGRLTQALGVGGEHDGLELTPAGPVALLSPTSGVAVARIRRGPRVGISVAADREWRFWIDDDPYVSAYRRSPRASVAEL